VRDDAAVAGLSLGNAVLAKASEPLTLSETFGNHKTEIGIPVELKIKCAHEFTGDRLAFVLNKRN